MQLLKWGTWAHKWIALIVGVQILFWVFGGLVMTAIPIDTVAEPFIRLRAIRHLENGYIVILPAGTGNPYVTTDYPAVQRALELRSDAILAAKNGIDGIYTADPNRDTSARRFKQINYNTFILRNLKALDQSAASSW